MNKKELNLPARENFPRYKMVVRQPEEPLGYDAKMRIRGKAKNVGVYRTPVKTEPPVVGHNDAGEEIAIDTLGRYLFGVPGYKAHIVVIPTEARIEIQVFCKEFEAGELLAITLERLGLELMYTVEIDQENQADNLVVPPYGAFINHAEAVWGQVRESLKECGDIGDFKPDDFLFTERRVGVTNTENKPMISADDLFEVYGGEVNLNTTGAQALYATLATEGMKRLAPDLDFLHLIAFGEEYGHAVSGWSGRYGNLDDITEELTLVFSDKGSLRLACYAEGDWFSDSVVQQGWKRVYDYLKEGRVKNVAH